MSSIKLKSIFMLLLLIVEACTSSDDPGPGNNPVDLNNDEKTLLAEAYQVPGDIYRSSFDLIGLAIDAGYYTSVAAGTGQLTLTGTLNVDNQANLSYSASPNNQLVVNLPSETVTFVFREYSTSITQGDLRDNMQQSHGLSFDAIKEGEYDVTVESNLSGGQRELEIEGEVELDDKVYIIDLKAVGQYLFNVDNTGSELEINDQYGGTIITEGWQADIQENWYYNNVYSSSAGVNAENAIRSFDNDYEIGGVNYSFENGRIQTVFRDGRPNEYDVANPPWTAEGRLVRGNQEIGELDWNIEGQFIKIFLRTADENIELQSYRTQ